MPTNWKKLLGNAVATPEQRTPLGIRYLSNGFDHVRPKLVTKALRWLENRKVPPVLIAEYLEYANLFIADERYIPLTIDAAYTEMRKKYLNCGGKWADAARKINTGQIIVEVHAAPIWSPHWNTYAVGLAWGSKNLIQATCVAMNGLMSSPATAGPLRKFSDLMRWEMGNLLSLKAGHKVNTLADEKGDSSPCSTTRAAALLDEPRLSSIIQP